MSKSKRNNNRKPSRPAPLPTINASDFAITEFKDYVDALDAHFFGNNWDQKHLLLQVDKQGKIIAEFAIPLTAPYDQVIPLLPLSKGTFALLFFSESWLSSSSIFRPSQDPNRVEVRSVMWVDIEGRTVAGMRIRGEHTYTFNESFEYYGHQVVVLHEALSQHVEVPRFIKMRIALKLLIDFNKGILTVEGLGFDVSFEKLFALPNHEDILVDLFADFADLFAAARKFSHMNVQAKQTALVEAVPHLSPLDLELELRALLPEGYELPKLFCSDEASLV